MTSGLVSVCVCFQDGTMEDNVHNYVDRNVYCDVILSVIMKHAGSRRVMILSFDPDICIM